MKHLRKPRQRPVLPHLAHDGQSVQKSIHPRVSHRLPTQPAPQNRTPQQNDPQRQQREPDLHHRALATHDRLRNLRQHHTQMHEDQGINHRRPRLLHPPVLRIKVVRQMVHRLRQPPAFLPRLDQAQLQSTHAVRVQPPYRLRDAPALG